MASRESRRRQSSLWSSLALLSNFAISAVIIGILWEIYHPNLTTPNSAVHEVGGLGLLSVLYLSFQFKAIESRSLGSTGAEVLDLLMSFIPICIVLVWLGIQIYAKGISGAWNGMTTYQMWAILIFFPGALVDVVVGTKIAFKMMFLSDELITRGD